MNKYSVIFTMLFFVFSVSAQEKLGVSNSNYSSTNSIFLNPSSSVDSRTFIQFNLVGANVYLMNNQAYLPQFSVSSSLNGNTLMPKISTIPFRKFVYLKTEVNGPAFVLSHKEIGIGFFIRGRAEVDIRNIPYELTKILTQQSIDTTQEQYGINIRNAKISEMAWVEYGVNFGKMLIKSGKTMITAGVNAKYLTGINIAYFNLEKLKFNADDAVVDIENLKGKVRYNTPEWKSGKGVGTDIGITYKKTLDWIDSYQTNAKKSNCTFVDYRYKLGISLLDLGLIRFNKNTFKGNVSGSTTINNYQTTNLDSLFKADFQTSQQINKPIWATLPTALSIQMDWNLSYYFDWEKDRHLYLNTTAIQSVTTSRMIGVQRANLISIAPRFEIKNFEVAVPLTFHRYIYPQVGLGFRFRTFVLGFDNVCPLLFKKDTYGVNIYFNLGISMFKNPACKVGHKEINVVQKFIDGVPFLAHVQKRAKERKAFEEEEKRKQKELDDCPEMVDPENVNQKKVDKEIRKKERKQIINWFKRKLLD